MKKVNTVLKFASVLGVLFLASCCASTKTQSGVTKAHAIIEKQMDTQAKDLMDVVENAKIQRVFDGIEVEFSNNVFFEFDRYALRDSAFLTLKHFITVLNKYPNTTVEVQGHTDNQGSGDYNMTLSQNRANSASVFLKQNDVDESRITIKGFGATMPEYDNATEEGKQMNRRVEFLIKPNQKMIADALQKAKE